MVGVMRQEGKEGDMCEDCTASQNVQIQQLVW